MGSLEVGNEVRVGLGYCSEGEGAAALPSASPWNVRAASPARPCWEYRVALPGLFPKIPLCPVSRSPGAGEQDLPTET